ncbi:MAG: prolyl oligopeptidase family serine peptidase [Polyangiaceae bacterium]
MTRSYARLRSLAPLSLLAVTACPSAPPSLPITTASASASPAASAADYPNGAPIAAKKPVSDTYHGVTVTDEYRWMEDGDAADVKAWSDKENAFARKFLDARPGREKIKAELKKLMGSESPDWPRLDWAGGKLFALKSQPPKQQPFITVLASTDKLDTEKVVVDPNVIDPKGGTSIDWFRVSPDGKHVAVSMSEGGSESGDVHVYETDTGKELTGDRVLRVNGGTAGGSLAWLKDGSGFFYTRYPAKGERKDEDLFFFQETWFHALGGDPKADKPSLTKDLPRVAEIQLQVSDDGKWLLASVANGDGGDFDQWILDLGADAKKSDLTKWRRLASIPDKIVEAHFAPDGEIWLRSKKDAPKGKLLKMAPKDDLAKATVAVPESDVVIDGFVVTKTRVYTGDLVGGPYQVRAFDRAGKARAPIALDPVSSVWRMLPIGTGDDLLLRTESYLHPGGWSLYTDKDAKLAPTPLAKKSPASFDDAEVVRDTCTSKDGTKVPINILRKKGTKLDGSNPLLLTGYGGYGVSESPYYDVTIRVWLDAGGVYADTNLRGGSEFGEAWHVGGNLTHKQNVFDDFIGCAKYTIDQKYTTSDKLTIAGASNGGLLMGAALTQAPNLFKAVVAMVGIQDMLRVETTPNGEFNVPEFGTVQDKDLFTAMYAYSPYHHVKEGTKYPAAMFMTGANDPRVDPYHSRKMVARMRAANPDGTVYLRISGNTGHGFGTPLDEQIDQTVDFYAFLFSQVGASLP